jgi:predicted nucleotidyltransferase
MAGLFTLQSDIDPLVYGARNCRKAYSALQQLLKDNMSKFKQYTPTELQMLFDFRSKDTIMSLEDFERVEARKAFQGKYDGVDYFVRFVKDYGEVNEKYGDVVYESAGYAKISATVSDDSEALFTPCTYRLEKVGVLTGPNLSDLTEIASFRGRFCMQAMTGESVTAQGKVERVIDKRNGSVHHRIIIGNGPADFMALLKP